MIRLWLFFVFACATTNVFAGEITLPQKTLSASDMLRGQFVDERIMAGFDGPMRSSGHFVIAPSRGLIWATEKPFITTMVITSDGLVQNVKGSVSMKMPTKSAPFISHLYDILGGVLAGRWNNLDDDFIVSQSSDLRHWNISLKPKPTNVTAMPFTLITVKGASFVEDVTLMKADGDSEALHFTHQNVSPLSLTAAENALFDEVTQ